MKVLTLFGISLLLLVFNNKKSAVAVDENEDCDYDHCEGQNFVCATDGNDFQYFRNLCYMRTFNDCNRAGKQINFKQNKQTKLLNSFKCSE